MATTRFPKGITTAAKTEPFGEFILPDRTKAHIFWEDFDYKLQASASPDSTHDWSSLIVEAGTGTGTQVLIDGDGGKVLLTNADANNDEIFLRKIGESFLFEVGKKLWFDCIMQVNDPTNTFVVMGIQAIEANPADISDGVFFFSENGADDLRLVVEKDNVATSTLMIADLQADTDTRCSFFYNGSNKIFAFVNGALVATSVTDNLPDDETLTIVFGIRNGEAAVKTMTVDYIMAAKER